MVYSGSHEEHLRLTAIDGTNQHVLKERITSGLSLLWCQDDDTKLIIDHKPYSFTKNTIICLTEFHGVEIQQLGMANLVRFNRQFYCVVEYDSEVGCKGLLFFGASQLPIIKLCDNEIEKFETLWRLFQLEMTSKDNLQLEMLQTMLKRLLILCARLYKDQYKPSQDKNYDMVREFNFLVEQHFREKHTVSEYAELMNKSPKTVSNLFSKIGKKTPLQYIQERRLLEARRLLQYTDKQVTEIAYEIGFEDVQTFSRFFKRHEGISPKEYKGTKYELAI